MTEYILLNRPKINEIPDFIPVSKGGGYENIALPNWLNATSVGAGLENTGADLKLSSLLFAGSAEERILKDLMGTFYIRDGMDVTKKSADTVTVSAGKFHLNNVDYDFSEKDISITGKANGYYWIVVDASGALNLAPRTNPPDRNANMIGKIFVANNNIDQLYNNGRRIDSTVNTLKDLINTDGIYTKHIAVTGAGTDSMLRSDGIIVAPHIYDQNGTQTQKDINVENPVKVEIRHADGTVLNQANTTINLDNLKILEHQGTTTDKSSSSEYLVIPIFVDIDGNVILIRPQSSLPNQNDITELGILNALSIVKIPQSVRSISTMVGVLILQGTETSLIGNNAFYEPFKSNVNTILRVIDIKIPTAKASNTGKFLGSENDNITFLPAFLGGNIKTDVFWNDNNQVRSFKTNESGLLLSSDVLSPPSDFTPAFASFTTHFAQNSGLFPGELGGVRPNIYMYFDSYAKQSTKPYFILLLDLTSSHSLDNMVFAVTLQIFDLVLTDGFANQGTIFFQEQAILICRNNIGTSTAEYTKTWNSESISSPLRTVSVHAGVDTTLFRDANQGKKATFSIIPLGKLREPWIS